MNLPNIYKLQQELNLKPIKAAMAIEWIEANPVRAKWLDDNYAKNAFAKSLSYGLHKYGSLTERQIAAIDKNLYEASKPKPEAPDVAGEGLLKLEAMFSKALGSGLKRPALIIGDIKLSPAKPTGVNPGAIYVKLKTPEEGSVYQGKIVGGKFYATRDAAMGISLKVDMICADPLAAAVASGKETGQCACCGKTLTDPVSIADGIGPICKAKYF